MTIQNLVSELWGYAQSREYREGVFVEVSGLVIDIFLLIIAARLVVHFVSRQARSTTIFTSSFFVVQFLREVFLFQLRTGNVKEVDVSLRDAFENGQLASLFSHVLYGNTENIRDLLQIRMRDGFHIEGHRQLTAEDRLSCAKEAKSLLERLDHLLILLSSLRQDDYCLRAYEYRLIFNAIKDYLVDLSESTEEPPPRTYAPMSTSLASATDRWFLDCKKILDKHQKKAIRHSYARLFLILPKIILYRFFVKKLRKFKGKPYTDPFGSNFFSFFCLFLNNQLDHNFDKILEKAGVDKRRLTMMQNQHVNFSQEESISMLELIQPHVEPSVWNIVLANSIIADVDRQPITLITVDSVKANALFFYAKLATKDESTSDLMMKTFQSLWNLKPNRGF